MVVFFDIESSILFEPVAGWRLKAPAARFGFTHLLSRRSSKHAYSERSDHLDQYVRVALSSALGLLGIVVRVGLWLATTAGIAGIP